MISRRTMLELAGGGAAAAGTGLLPQWMQAEAAPLNLPAALSEGTRGEAVLEALPGKKPLIKLDLPAAELRNADRLFPHARSRRTTRSSCAITSRTFRRSTPRPGSSRSAARAPTDRPSSPRRPEEDAGVRGHRRLPVLRQPARPVPAARRRASSGATARWAAPAGRARASRTSSTRSASRRRRSRSCSTAPTGRSSTRRRTSSRASRLMWRWRRRRSSPTR